MTAMIGNADPKSSTCSPICGLRGSCLLCSSPMTLGLSQALLIASWCCTAVRLSKREHPSRFCETPRILIRNCWSVLHHRSYARAPIVKPDSGFSMNWLSLTSGVEKLDRPGASPS